MRPGADPHQLNLPLDDWELVKASVPIACVDVVLTRDVEGLPVYVALIQRHYRDGSLRWCHLGGRIGLDEGLRAAGIRHLRTTLSLTDREHALIEAGFPENPTSHYEFFRSEDLADSAAGVDPDKHAVSWCYRYCWPLGTDLVVAEGGEALDVQWFDISQLPTDLWPGTAGLVERAVAAHHLDETYSSVSAQADTHNTLMWQTPVLAMTAQAFLLTIGLGSAIDPLSRLAASVLSTVVSALSIQLMLKHSAMQRRDSILLKRIEEVRGMAVFHIPPRFDGHGPAAWLIRQRSRVWWLVGMAVFGLVSAGVVVASVLQLRP